MLARSVAATVPLLPSFPRKPAPSRLTTSPLAGVEQQASSLLAAYRAHGHRLARTDPLELEAAVSVPELELAYHGLSLSSLDGLLRAELLPGLAGAPLSQFWEALRRVYCGSIGVEAAHLRSAAERFWLHSEFEKRRIFGALTAETRRRVLGHLTASETLEHYLSKQYPEVKRFSLEGCDTLIVLLHAIAEAAASHDAAEVVAGMAHRGRVNALVNFFGMPVAELLNLFAKLPGENVANWDLKYHLGYSSEMLTASGPVALTLLYNPSHLESVTPVVCGYARGRAQKLAREGKGVLPVLVHGDAAFNGQGVVAETLNLSRTRGYGLGGTLHIVVNNQIGFTASDLRDVRSTPYSTDWAKGVEAPIFHVNAADPDAALLALSLALDFRAAYRRDVVIDLVGFRREGHNEQDDPRITQPFMYRRVASHPGLRAIYAKKLEEDRVADASEAEAMAVICRDALAKKLANNMPFSGAVSPQQRKPSPYNHLPWTTKVGTGAPLDVLTSLLERMARMPEDFEAHADVKAYAERCLNLAADKEGQVDWGLAENLACATLLEAGFGVRISGMDCGRGTFHHRHAVWHDQDRTHREAGVHLPLQHLFERQPPFDVIDSPLSEEAVVGFEYGYGVAAPEQLVIWEAQYGDFVNNAQVIIDQFIACGEFKWGYQCGLVMLLPHGHEGVGPEHSNAHLGRFLQLCADENIQVCKPSTSAQFFHLLRRQMLRPLRKPLVVMTPKTELMGEPEARSGLSTLVDGAFEPLRGVLMPSSARKVVLASGKLVHSLKRAAQSRRDVALLAVEQLYPFPAEELARALAKWPEATDVVWAQEESQNHGAWHFVRDAITASLTRGQTLRYVGRRASPASAGCNSDAHHAEQRAILDQAVGAD